MAGSRNRKKSLLRFQVLYDMAEVCAQKGIKNAIICPGSRCAPLTFAFAKHPKINTHTISDERSAAFIAGGMSLYSIQPTVLICTSGSAVYQFATGIVECFFQHIPLLVITADRPKEWVGQWDGQTIKQHHIYGEHVKKSYELPQEYSHPDDIWYINRITNEAINLANAGPKGPVHINVPLREPLYVDTTIDFSSSIRIIEERETKNKLSAQEVTSLLRTLSSYKKVMIIVGQHHLNHALTQVLDTFSKLHNIPVIVDITSNQHSLPKGVAHADVILECCTPKIEKELAPQLLITWGKSILSKRIKQFIRTHQPAEHWHIQNHRAITDPYQGLTHTICMPEKKFFTQLSSTVPSKNKMDKKKYYQYWEDKEKRSKKAILSFFEHPQCNEFHLVNTLLKNLPKKCHLHLANSLAVRYAALLGLNEEHSDIRVFSNRGVSGIDGCTSVSVGYALASKTLTLLITGDMAFFYDRNAFWHNYPLPNLRIVVLNNHSGAIFSLIEGPSRWPDLAPYFTTHQQLCAKNVADEFGFDYLKVDTINSMHDTVRAFFNFDKRTKILEIETNNKIVQETMKQFKSHIKKNYAAQL